jgi:hypothetical protein
MPVGLKGAMTAHEANTGSLPYSPIKLSKSGDKVLIRILAVADEPPIDPETEDPVPQDGVRYIYSLYFHRKFGVLDERCLVDADTADPNLCALCRVKAPRTVKTFIPMRERGDTQLGRVKWFVVGREALQSFITVQGVIPGNDLTGLDFIIIREGEKLQTRYMLYPQNDTSRPLSDQERALEFPDPMEFYPCKSEEEIEKVALDFERASKATATGGGGGEEEQVPF